MYEDLISVNIWVRQRNLLFLWRYTSAEARLMCLVSFSVKCPLLLRFFVCLFWFSVLTQLHYKIHLLMLIKRQHNGFVISEFRVSFNVTTIYITAVPQLHWWHKSPTAFYEHKQKTIDLPQILPVFRVLQFLSLQNTYIHKHIKILKLQNLDYV